MEEFAKPGAGAVDVRALARALARGPEKASKQFSEGLLNVLVLAFPETGAPIPTVCWHPDLSLIPAFYGEHALVTRPGGPIVDEFRPKGNF